MFDRKRLGLLVVEMVGNPAAAKNEVGRNAGMSTLIFEESIISYHFVEMLLSKFVEI